MLRRRRCWRSTGGGGAPPERQRLPARCGKPRQLLMATPWLRQAGNGAHRAARSSRTSSLLPAQVADDQATSTPSPSP